MEEVNGPYTPCFVSGGPLPPPIVEKSDRICKEKVALVEIWRIVERDRMRSSTKGARRDELSYSR